MFDTAVQPSLPMCTRAAERDRFESVRRQSEALAANLTPEDQAIQSMPDVSPTKWHLAHTSWFFETFLLTPLLPGYRAFDPAFAYLFNSYYEAVGPRHPRPQRGLLSRPTVDAIGAYRDHVTAGMLALIENADEAIWEKAAPLIELGLNH
ncbi:MAG TPA: DinB family protein, partial [Stellaceae bacterium]|nr:DinB family protein [Stellaceae bacterium]